ncbi:MAG: toll/interleukin-1 receptor domain-containing protein [Thermoplasmata archaeon]|nr:toll/interleukin-1 receptor domain-containing protein [Thermoplasmata archaeon]
MPKYEIFLSHSEQDEVLINMIAKSLEAIDLDVYVEEHETNYGSDVVESVCNAIDESECLLVVLTDQSIKSQWVNQEIGYAFANEIKIIPVRVGDIKVTGMITNIKGIRSKGGNEELIANILRFFIEDIEAETFNFTCEKCGEEDEWDIPTQEYIYEWEKKKEATSIICENCEHINLINPKTLLLVD